MKYLWIGTAIIFLLVVVLGIIVWLTREKADRTEQDPPEDPKEGRISYWIKKGKGWLDKNYGWMLLLVFCHGVIWYTLPERYMMIVQNLFTWILHVGIFLVFQCGRTTEKGKQVFTLLGKICILCLIIGTAITLYRWWGWEMVTPPTGKVRTANVRQDDGTSRAYIRNFWKNKGYDESTTRKMICIAWRESGFGQYDRAGGMDALTTKIPDADMSATGVYQIRKTVWGKEAMKLGFDIDTMDGNLSMAHYIHQKHGFAPWAGDPGEGCDDGGNYNGTMSDTSNPETYLYGKEEVLAPVSDTSAPAWASVETGGRQSAVLPQNGCIHITINDGDMDTSNEPSGIVCQNQSTDVFRGKKVKKWKFQSAFDFPVKVVVRFK